MATLLHIDSSVFSAGASASRPVTVAFREAWIDNVVLVGRTGQNELSETPACR